MAKVIYCNEVRPTPDCNHVIRGKTEEEVLQKAGEHAKEHGLEPTPELMANSKHRFGTNNGLCTGEELGLSHKRSFVRLNNRRPYKSMRYRAMSQSSRGRD
jgi:predicted small metal-binding protein